MKRIPRLSGPVAVVKYKVAIGNLDETDYNNSNLATLMKEQMIQLKR